MNPMAEPHNTRIVAGPFQTNTYLLSSGNEAVIVDPGAQSSTILEALALNNVEVKAIIATHGHMDHLFDIADLKKALKCQFYMSAADQGVLEWSRSVSEKYMGMPLQEVSVDRFLKEGDRISFGESSLEILELPGHTPGSIGLLTQSLFLTGDTLFRGTIGRTDLGGSMDRMNETLQRIKKMEPTLAVLPGHGSESNLGTEIRTNPFLV